ncbi:cellulose-binding protein [Streptomyces sp. NPDC102406]|uniref:cellulose-binding protein n=1 Tax=Streptomyces sp. NPDC102406 TaxID=3366171 RepID=UPI0037F9DB47
MSGAAGASASPYGFVVVRGRGYRPEQVQARVAELSGALADARDRVARLTARAEELEVEAERLRGVVAHLAPQTYETLGRRAQYLLELAEEEAAAVRYAAQTEANALAEAAAVAGRAARDAARAHADEVLAEADAWARRREEETRARADEIRAAARSDAKETGEEALGVLREARERGERLLAEQAEEHAERTERFERESAGIEAAADARETASLDAAQERLSAARRALAEAGEAARHRQEDAEAAAAELLARARAQEEKITRETERLLREHDEARDELRAHMDHVRNSLASLTGRATAE